MTPNDARALVLQESTGEAGAVVTLRIGKDPGAERMGRLLAALEVLFEDLRGKPTLDRQLAAALHQLALQIESQASSWEVRGRTWREELIDEEIPNLALAVESLFEDDWLGD